MERTTQVASRSTPVRPERDENDGGEEEEEEEGKNISSPPPPPPPPSSSSSSSPPPSKGSASVREPGDVAVKMTDIEINHKKENTSTAESSSRIADSILCSGSVHPPKPASASRSSEGREVHRVTFAEPCNKYVHSDSGIVLSPDDADYNDATGGPTASDQNRDSGDDESGDVDADDVTDGSRVRLPPVNPNAVPGPPIIKLHRCRSSDSHDNPFLSDGELHRKADYIIAHSTFLRTRVVVADPDQVPPETANGRDPDPIRSAEGVVSHSDSSPTLEPSAEAKSEDIRIESPSSATAQRISPKSGALPRLNGELDEPLLSPKKEGNGLGSLKNKQSKSKEGICCGIQ